VPTIGLLLCLTAALLGGASPSTNAAWRSLAPGLEIGTFAAGAPGGGKGQITVLRADPALWDLEFAGLSQEKEGAAGRTAKRWAKDRKFTAAINAGMFAEDYRTHLGYLRQGDHVHNGRIVGKYESAAAFGPTAKNDAPRFRIFDLDEPGMAIESIRRDYSLVVQNLRLIKRPGMNRWEQQPKRWSEAALGEDAEGRILFIFARSPFSMHDLNRELLAAGIGVVAAQHLEGGPEAQLYIRIGKEEIEMFGSFETDFEEDDDNNRAWPVPNVLGIKPRAHGR
jgi:hypothetical protein